MQKRGKGNQAAAQNSGEAAPDDSQQKGGFERQVPSDEAFLDETNPHAQRNRNAEPQDKIDLLGGGAFFTEKKLLEFERSNQSARHRCRNAQLDQQIDEDEPLFHHGDRSGQCSTKVILSGGESSRSELCSESKDPYELNGCG